MTINTLNRLKVPIVKINPDLNRLIDVPMFEDKIAEANEVLRLVGLPDPMIRRQSMVRHAKRIVKQRRMKRLRVS